MHRDKLCLICSAVDLVNDTGVEPLERFQTLFFQQGLTQEIAANRCSLDLKRYYTLGLGMLLE